MKAPQEAAFDTTVLVKSNTEFWLPYCSLFSLLLFCFFLWYFNFYPPSFFLENRVYDLQGDFQKRKSKAEGSLYVIGDSLSRDFALEYFKRYELCKVRFKFCETLFLSTYPRWDRDKIPKLHNWDDFRPKIVLDGISNVFRKPDMRNNSSMLVINFAVHFARALNFTTYQDLIENFVSLVKNRKKLFGSNARVVWKTTTETHFLSVFGRADGRFLTSTVSVLLFTK